MAKEKKEKQHLRDLEQELETPDEVTLQDLVKEEATSDSNPIEDGTVPRIETVPPSAGKASEPPTGLVGLLLVLEGYNEHATLYNLLTDARDRGASGKEVRAIIESNVDSNSDLYADLMTTAAYK